MTDRERIEEIRATILANRDRNDWMHRSPCSMRDALDLLARVDALTAEVERLRQERRDVTHWRDQTLADENARLRRIETATKAFVTKVEELTPAINDAFAFRQNHGIPYTGPNWCVELSDIKAELDAAAQAVEGRDENA